jgi:hypothetical protein
LTSRRCICQLGNLVSTSLIYYWINIASACYNSHLNVENPLRRGLKNEHIGLYWNLRFLNILLPSLNRHTVSLEAFTPRIINLFAPMGEKQLFFAAADKVSLFSRSANARNVHSVAQTSWVTTRDESREMMALWPDVVRDLTDAGRHLDVPEATKWLAKVRKGFLSLRLLFIFKITHRSSCHSGDLISFFIFGCYIQMRRGF